MVLAAGNCVKIYRSKNLKNWDFQSSFGEQLGNHDGVWECPDLFELNVQNQPKLTQWVMIVSVGDATQLENGSRTQYFVGRFDGHTFKVDDE